MKHLALKVHVLHGKMAYLRHSLRLCRCNVYEPPKFGACVSDLTLVEAFHEVQHLLP